MNQVRLRVIEEEAALSEEDKDLLDDVDEEDISEVSIESGKE